MALTFKCALALVGALSAATCERFCEILRREDSVVLARARTVWCMVDPASGRPKRIDPATRGYFWGHSLPAPSEA